MKYPREVLKRFIETIQEDGVNVTKWEEDFLESVAEQLELRGSLSEKQIEILDRIYAEKTP